MSTRGLRALLAVAAVCALAYAASIYLATRRLPQEHQT